MLKEKRPQERIVMAGLLVVAIAAGSFAIVRGQRRPAPIVFENLAKPADNPPKIPITDRENVPSALLVVDATGAVRKPGVLHLPAGSRVEDAIEAAGGALPDADLDAVNLAAKLTDGTQVYVPHKGAAGDQKPVDDAYRGGIVPEAYAPRHSPGSSRPSGHGRSGKKEPPSQPVSLNAATAQQLEAIPGIGPATAQKIVEYRQEHGGFASVDDLLAVKGIGPKKLSAMRKYLKL
ncbi:MAG TPA: helix-hairpin-helix domain-containing protein [Fimbriimonadaceae bacterium]|nr:helix-hairpin-helix domain-containing protein [Fimbriimonadaceae bacterium]